MIIDFRLRPPAGDFLNSAQFNIERNAKIAEGFGMWQLPSTVHRSMDMFFGEMEQAGITMGVLPGRVSYAFGDITCASIRQIMEQYPGKFAAFAGVDLYNPRSAFEVMDKEVINGPFAGINVEPLGFQVPMSCDDRRIYPIYEYAQEYNIPILLMTGGLPKTHISLNFPGHLENVAVDFPNLTIVSTHGCWPFSRELVHVALRRENIYIQPDIYSMGLPGYEDYIFAANNFLQDRFLYASAHPTMPMTGCVEFFKKLKLKEEVIPKIFYKNAQRVLGLKNSKEKA